MIKLYHSPNSRSTSVVSLLRLMGKDSEVQIKTVQIKRTDGAGQSDAANPHPEGKVPLLDVDGRPIRERGAIMLWLTDHFDSPLGRGPDHPERGAYLSWLFYYGNVVEPVMYLTFLDIADNALVHEWCRDQPTMIQTIETALSQHKFLVDDQISAADLLVSSPFQWFPDLVPETGLLRDWIDRCLAAQDSAFIAAFEADATARLGMPDTAKASENA